MSDTVIAVNELHHTYLADTPLATVALRGANLRVQRGEIAAIIGADGAGKSTLLRFLNGLLRPGERGRVEVLGQDLAAPDMDLRRLRRRVGLVFQSPHHQLFEHYVGDDVAFGLRQFGLPQEEIRRRARWAMEAVGLDFEAFKDRQTFSLSGGEMRRVALAGVLAMQPEILLLDEATTGLDPDGRREVHELLRRLCEQEGITIVLASNDMSEVAELADTVTVLYQGRTVLVGPVCEVFQQRDILVSCGLALPDLVQLVFDLREAGLAIPGTPLNAHEIEEAIWQALTA